MGGLDLLWAWHDPAIASALGWYREVAANRKPAKFRIAPTLPVKLEPDGASEGELWAELERLTSVAARTRLTDNPTQAQRLTAAQHQSCPQTSGSRRPG